MTHAILTTPTQLPQLALIHLVVQPLLIFVLMAGDSQLILKCPALLAPFRPSPPFTQAATTVPRSTTAARTGSGGLLQPSVLATRTACTTTMVV
ncbi:hypothetical protein IJJ39_00550 [Candidatus Saccharibacteria bacterium]|nr:hypothetical protein [Candidatus Saccharibacteria bacterium]